MARQLFIDSRDRIPGGTTTDFQIQLRQQLVVDPSHTFRIDQLRIPVVIPLIQTGINDLIYFTLGGVLQTATLTRQLHRRGTCDPGADRPEHQGDFHGYL